MKDFADDSLTPPKKKKKSSRVKMSQFDREKKLKDSIFNRFKNPTSKGTFERQSVEFSSYNNNR